MTVDPAAGGRVASLRADGHELLVTRPSDQVAPDPMRWGSFPMVPWAGRVRHGRFTHDGRAHRLPIGLPPHAIHGTGYVQPWTVTESSDRTLAITVDLGADWPFGGSAEQRFTVDGPVLTLAMMVTAAAEPMPAMVGWHPWFRREVRGGGALELDFEAGQMYALDREAIPTGDLIDAPPGPWDNCFTAVTQPIVLRWPGLGQLKLSSSCDHWVVYDEPDHALCVEPQTDAPDSFNRHPAVVAAGQSLEATFELRWQT